MRRLSALVIFVAFLLSCGGHWYVLQVVAWTNMVADFSQQVPVTTAIKMTLSGEYPCKICKALAQQKQREQSAELKLPVLKKDFVTTPDFILVNRGFLSVRYPTVEFSSTLRPLTPPTPPPRCV